MQRTLTVLQDRAVSPGSSSSLGTTPSLWLHHVETNVVDALGPGRRAVVWVQGCSLTCPGCLVPETWRVRGRGGAGFEMCPEALANELMDWIGPNGERHDGVTLSGGEPSEQAAASAILLQTVHARGGNTWLYSGYRIEELVSRVEPAIDDLLASADVLVDGRFVRERAGAFLWRGSDNQRILYLTDAVPRPTPAQRALAGHIEVRLTSEGGLRVIGTPRPGFLIELRQRLAERGVEIRPEGPWR